MGKPAFILSYTTVESFSELVPVHEGTARRVELVRINVEALGHLLGANLILFLLYIVIKNCAHSFYPTDDGWLLGLAYRVFNGEIPHRDFFYVRPSLSLFIHSLWFYFPQDWVITLGRFSNYVFLFSPLVFALFIFRNFHKHIQPLSFYLVFIFSCIPPLMFSLPFPWHTTDGIFFSQTAILCLLALCITSDSRNKFILVFVSGLATGSAPLVKQNFAAFTLAVTLLSPWLLGIIFLNKLKKPFLTAQFVFLLGLVLPTLILFLYLYHHGALADFYTQIKSVSSAGAITFAGIRPYLTRWQPCLFHAALGFGLGIFGRSNSRAPRFIFWIGIILIISLISKLTGGLYLFIYLLAFGLGILLTSRHLSTAHRLGGLAFLLSLLVAWCSQISWGGPFPTRGLGLPCVFLLIWSYERARPPFFETGVRLTMAVLALGFCLSHLSRHTYLDVPWAEQHFKLAKIYPQFGDIQTGEMNAARISDLSRVIKEIKINQPGRPISVLPEHPLIYFLERIKNPAKVDWWYELEFPNAREALLKDLQNKNTVVLFENLKPQHPTSPLYFPEVHSWLKEHSKKSYPRLNFTVFEL